MIGKDLEREWSEVYLCYLEDEIVYIGSGKLNRHKHCNSGISHVYELNKLHFEGVVFDVKVQKFKTRKTALNKEIELIKKHLPKFNKVYTPKHTDKVSYMEKCRKFREVFKSKCPAKGANDYEKMYELLDQFLKTHTLSTIEDEGVIFRGRDFYKSKGCAKLAHLLMNHRLTPTKYSIKFLSLLKEALEDFYEVEFEFKNLIKGVTHNIEL